MTTTRPCQALYVHIPFCRTLCGYCDFYSQVLEPNAAGPLVEALLGELRAQAGPRGLRFDTVFVGGGTPTVLPVPELARLLGGVAGYVAGLATSEFTVEANPATVDEAVADVLSAAGVNRISIGAQSFEVGELAVLDRRHRPEQAAETVTLCRRHDIERLSLDLIFGIPGQTLASWQRSLEAAAALGPEHFSCYGLTYEPGTPLFERREAGQVQPVDEDVEADMYELAREWLAGGGWPQYEISNFARPGAECRHNLRYWHNEAYLGIGPAAAGFVDGVRYKNVADTAAYVAAVGRGESARVEEECLVGERRWRETAMLELRLVKGIDRREFARRYGVDPAGVFAAAIERQVDAGLLEMDEQGIRLTRRGFLLADTVIADFL